VGVSCYWTLLTWVSAADILKQVAGNAGHAAKVAVSSKPLFGGFFISGPLSVAHCSARSSGSLPSRKRLDCKLRAELSEDIA